VLSRFTAFLAIDRSEVVNAGGKLNQIVQPVDSPAGWDMDDQGRGSGYGGQTRNRRAAPMKKSLSRSMAMPGGAPPPARQPMPAASMPASMGPVVIAGGAMGAPSGGPPVHRADQAPRPTEAAPPPALAKPKAPYGPPAQPSVPMVPGRYEQRELEQERAVTNKAEAKPTTSAYHAKLDVLARELEAQARLSADVAILRVIRQRLTEWVEDVRSVGGFDDLAAAVEKLVQRLAVAIAGGTTVSTEAIAVAAELARLAAGATPPPAPKQSRAAFWK
jgi:Ca-activated chloride channel family protein